MSTHHQLPPASFNADPRNQEVSTTTLQGNSFATTLSRWAGRIAGAPDGVSVSELSFARDALTNEYPEYAQPIRSAAEVAKRDVLRRLGLQQRLVPTAPDQLGPFYRPPARSAVGSIDLTDPDTTGVPMQLTLTVVDAKGKPIPNAELHLWQADGDGQYDMGFDDVGKPEAAQAPQKLRGVVRTRGDGTASVQSVVPKEYALPEGGERPPHLHVGVVRPGRPAFVSQLYFASEYTEDSSGAPRFANPQNSVPLWERDDGARVGEFVIVV